MKHVAPQWQLREENSLYDHICSKRGKQLVMPLVDHVAALHAKSSALQLQYTFTKELSMHCAHP